jgi:hypothetical protein
MELLRVLGHPCCVVPATINPAAEVLRVVPPVDHPPPVNNREAPGNSSQAAKRMSSSSNPRSSTWLFS